MSLCDVKPAKNQEFTHIPPRTTESGNVIIIIFLMIGLLAALYYTFSSGFRSGESQLSRERADLAATEVLDYAQSIKQAVQTLQINGCDETEISFDVNVLSGIYVNPNAPIDASCHVFHPNGGNLNYQSTNSNILNPAFSGFLLYSELFFNADNRVLNVGSSKTELILSMGYLKEDVCKAINFKLGNDISYTAESILPSIFQGSFMPSAIPDLGDNDTSLQGLQSFCFYLGSSNYAFSQVLIAR